MKEMIKIYVKKEKSCLTEKFNSSPNCGLHVFIDVYDLNLYDVPYRHIFFHLSIGYYAYLETTWTS